MENLDEHSEQDPAEGSRETVEHNLARIGQPGVGVRTAGNGADRASDASRSDADTADKDRDALVKGARAGIANADGELPKDQI